MRKPGRFAAILAAACGALVLAPASALAADTIIAGPGLTYSGATYQMNQGERPLFQNNDSGTPHDVFARGRLGGRPLFRSPVITSGNALVNGTQYLTQGEYEFICSIHPFQMNATLQVSGDGTPVARPNIRVSILSGKVRRVRRTGKLAVRVRAATQSNGVALRLTLANRFAGRRAGINLAPGQARRVVFKLNRKLRKRLAGRKRAKAVVVGTVPFGAIKRAARVLK